MHSRIEAEVAHILQEVALLHELVAVLEVAQWLHSRSAYRSEGYMESMVRNKRLFGSRADYSEGR